MSDLKEKRRKELISIRKKLNINQQEFVNLLPIKPPIPIRTYRAYESEHITNSRNVPLNVLESARRLLESSTNYDTPKKKFNLYNDKEIEFQKIPLFNIEASAGLIPIFEGKVKENPKDFLSIPNLPKCDGALYAIGDSMYPLLKSGDIIAYKQITDYKNDIFWGEMYLIDVEVGEEEYVTVKFIHKSDKGEDYIKLVSQNKHHQDKDVLISKIRALAIIKASVRMHSMR